MATSASNLRVNGEWIAVFGRKIETVFRWPVQVTTRTKPNTIADHSMWANGSEMQRSACCYATEIGIDVPAPVPDALLVGGPLEDIEEFVTATQESMARASDLVLDGFILRTDTKIVRYPVAQVSLIEQFRRSGSRNGEPRSQNAEVVSWYARWLAIWVFYAIPDARVRHRSLHLSTENSLVTH